jgi:hypothetical protein
MNLDTTTIFTAQATYQMKYLIVDRILLTILISMIIGHLILMILGVIFPRKVTVIFKSKKRYFPNSYLASSTNEDLLNISSCDQAIQYIDSVFDEIKDSDNSNYEFDKISTGELVYLHNKFPILQYDSYFQLYLLNHILWHYEHNNTNHHDSLIALDHFGFSRYYLSHRKRHSQTEDIEI